MIFVPEFVVLAKNCTEESNCSHRFRFAHGNAWISAILCVKQMDRGSLKIFPFFLQFPSQFYCSLTSKLKNNGFKTLRIMFFYLLRNSGYKKCCSWACLSHFKSIGVYNFVPSLYLYIPRPSWDWQLLSHYIFRAWTISSWLFRLCQYQLGSLLVMNRSLHKPRTFTWKCYM